jgi:hypothetical protein
MDDMEMPIRIDKKQLIIFSEFAGAENEDKVFWFSQSSVKRIEDIETLQKLNLGKDASA